MEKGKKNFFSAKNITILAVLVALVVVLQVCGGYFVIGTTSLSFVLIPIVLGGILLGVWAGALLGFLFGFIVLMYGVSGTDAFTATLLAQQPALTVLTVLLKGILAGIVPALLYKVIAKKQKYVAVFVAAASAPLVNTGVFVLGALCMSGLFTEFATANGVSLTYFIFIGCAGINFIIEFALNLVLSPAIYTVINVVEKQILKKHTVKVVAGNGEDLKEDVATNNDNLS